jgi:ribonuclease BN (tRNA processing enzyme)
MANAPSKVTIRSYHVGFGDSYLLSFQYSRGERHVLIDFGSTGMPKPIVAADRMMQIAQNIKERTGGKLHAVVATHRHKDHISGFETKPGGKGTGDVIRALKPDLVVQPWTEDPKLDVNATGPDGKAAKGKAAKAKSRKAKSVRPAPPPGQHVAQLAAMQEVAAGTLQEVAAARFSDKALTDQLSFLGESNINNPSAVRNLMTMAENEYVFSGRKTKLEKVLPGVSVDVLGPPTVEQSEAIRKQKSKDPNEFWQFQANAMRFAAASGSGRGPTALFPRHVRARGPTFPVDARWLIFHAGALRGTQLLQIVRMLDTAMNNTSVILVFKVGSRSLLFPGDAQIENWEFALGQEKYKSLLENVNLYKVGHHGSRNATPKSLWKMFKHKSTDKSAKARLQSLMSTMEHKHGSEAAHTEVPRKTLVSELQHESSLFSTQQLKGKDFFHDVELTLS